MINALLKQNDSNKDKLFIVTIGKKLESTIKFMQNEVIASFELGTQLPKFDIAYPLLKIIDDYFLNEKANKVQILFPKFESLFSQKPQIDTLLPIEIPIAEEEVSDFTLFEPQPTELLPALLKHYIEILVHQYFLEAYLSEQASRMLSMKNATDNADDIIENLQLEYNKSRQEKITSELLSSSGPDTYAN